MQLPHPPQLIHHHSSSSSSSSSSSHSLPPPQSHHHYNHYAFFPNRTLNPYRCFHSNSYLYHRRTGTGIGFASPNRVMLLMEEKQWITVQQKTFTKWLVRALLLLSLTFSRDGWLIIYLLFFFFTLYYRLNNKLKARDLAIDDLVKDLSDGVCFLFLMPHLMMLAKYIYIYIFLLLLISLPVRAP